MESVQHGAIILKASLTLVADFTAMSIRHVPKTPFPYRGSWVRLLPGDRWPNNQFAMTAEFGDVLIGAWRVFDHDPEAITFRVTDSDDGSTIVQWECAYSELLAYVDIIERTLEDEFGLPKGLPDRDQSIIDLMRSGLTDPEIAKELADMEPQTVSNRLRELRRKHGPTVVPYRKDLKNR